MALFSVGANSGCPSSRTDGFAALDKTGKCVTLNECQQVQAFPPTVVNFLTEGVAATVGKPLPGPCIARLSANAWAAAATAPRPQPWHSCPRALRHLVWDAISLDVQAHSYTGRTNLAWVSWFAVAALLRFAVQETTARLRLTGARIVAAC